MDVRGCRSREQIETALQQLDEQKTPYKILFLDAPDDVLMRRYSETRRRPPHQHCRRASLPGMPF